MRGDTTPTALDIQKLNQLLPKDSNEKSTIAQIRFIPVEIIEAPNSPSNTVIQHKEAERLVK